ncbi:MAG: homoserine kinase [Candidatus Poribacteria bacterium]|nr:MAG: homoserine kinase [Candidatus Poribacteria bacterium]
MAARRSGVIRVQIPASTSNLGPGFDAIGLAVQVHSRYDITCDARRRGLEIHVEGLHASEIPTDTTNLTYRAFVRLFQQRGVEVPGLSVHVRNGIPLERGLGGSGSAILAGLLAANAWLGEPLSLEAILLEAARMDGHPDNVAASLYGGLRVVCWDGDRLLTLPVPCSDDLQVVFAIPTVQVQTGVARTLLPKQVPFEDARFNVGRVALLVAALAGFEYAYLSAAMRDRLHQPYRKRLVPQLDAVIQAAEEAGAWGAALSGSGPTVVALCTGDAEAVGEAMREAFSAEGVAAETLIARIDFRGATVALEE